MSSIAVARRAVRDAKKTLRRTEAALYTLEMKKLHAANREDYIIFHGKTIHLELAHACERDATRYHWVYHARALKPVRIVQSECERVAGRLAGRTFVSDDAGKFTFEDEQHIVSVAVKEVKGQLALESVTHEWSS